MAYGKKIASLRKQNNMTQGELGKKLNVSFQAVSKWENDQSEPDLDTIKKICELFNITTDEFFGLQGSGPAQTVIHQKTVIKEPVTILGYCEDCKKPLKDKEDYVVVRQGRGGHIQHIYCKECKAKREKQKLETEKAERLERRKKGFIGGGVASGGMAVLAIASLISTKTAGMAILGAIVLIYAAFTFTSQMIWENSVFECFCMFLKSFTLPGVIFSLDIGGLIFLIAFKLIGAVLCALLSVFIAALGIFVAIIYSMFSFPFALYKQIKGDA